MKTANHVKFSQAKSNDLVTIRYPNQSPIEEIPDLRDNLPLNACVELIRRISQPSPHHFWTSSLADYPQNCCSFLGRV